ncbi:MAG: DegV family protein [Heliobacteriaceae bacterium]|nr:DegV family protein [Heliobacteriaceae bacterium]MDD4586834.1 DegV family protein [Heliobacteriaceae bacterium]
MTDIYLVTDSTAYLTAGELETLRCTVVPLRVIAGNDVFLDNEKDPEEFAQLLRTIRQLPTTSQPPVAEFVTQYERLTANGGAVFSLHMSSVLSGTYQAALMAARTLPGRRIHVIDSLSTIPGLLFQLETARQVIDQGGTEAEITQEIIRVRDQHALFFMVDSLEHLYKGGRIGGAQALFGSFLQIKPILYLNAGKVEVFEKIRTRKRAMLRIAEYFRQKWGEAGPLRVAVAHIGAREEALAMRELLSSMVPAAKPTVHAVGPVIATHVGPGAIGVIFAPL